LKIVKTQRIANGGLLPIAFSQKAHGHDLVYFRGRADEFSNDGQKLPGSRPLRLPASQQLNALFRRDVGKASHRNSVG
jgi:hypothetical protein